MEYIAFRHDNKEIIARGADFVECSDKAYDLAKSNPDLKLWEDTPSGGGCALYFLVPARESEFWQAWEAK